MEKTVIHVLHYLRSATRTNLPYFLVFPVKRAQRKRTSSPTSMVGLASYRWAACMFYFAENQFWLTLTSETRVICTIGLTSHQLSMLIFVLKNVHMCSSACLVIFLLRFSYSLFARICLHFQLAVAFFIVSLSSCA
jgi:hypothetical protein